MQTEKEKWMARKLTLQKYNRSAKKKAVNKRYRETHRAQCSAQSIAWQRKNRDRVRELARLRYATPEGKKVRDQIEKRYNAKNREKRLAKDQVHNAIQRKSLVRAAKCQLCSATAVEGHHPDYTKPLTVVWVCKKCHTKLHYQKG